MTDQSKLEIADLSTELEKLYVDEDLYWREKSKIIWEKDGDWNTVYFHNHAYNHKSTNEILGSPDKNGQWRDDDESMERITTDYIRELFNTSNLRDFMIDKMLDDVTSRVTPEMNQKLTIPYSVDEVISALFQMSPLKSRGPNRLPVIFSINICILLVRIFHFVSRISLIIIIYMLF